MGKIYFSKRCITLFISGMLSGIFFFNPQKALAGKVPGNETNVTDQTINGTVRDAVSTQPLAGATIGVKGTNRRTASDVNGSFTISVPDNNPVLVISYVGYTTQEIPVGSSPSVDIRLQPNAGDLAQLVVVGYGTQN